MNQNKNQPPREVRRKPTIRQVFASVLAAAFGVQNEKNRRRDFTDGKPINYIIAGLIVTILFVLLLVGSVKLIMGAFT